MNQPFPTIWQLAAEEIQGSESETPAFKSRVLSHCLDIYPGETDYVLWRVQELTVPAGSDFGILREGQYHMLFATYYRRQESGNFDVQRFAEGHGIPFHNCPFSLVDEARDGVDLGWRSLLQFVNDSPAVKLRPEGIHFRQVQSLPTGS